MTGFATLHPVHYLPIATTVVSVLFAAALHRRWRARRSGPHLLWWCGGMVTYGLGTALESAITLFGNSVALTKAWYVAGALLGGYPLAQGSVYLLLARRTANALTAVTVPFLVVIAALVALSPAAPEALQAHRPSGAVIGWTWVRALTPFINLYAVVFLIGGAIVSAVRYARRGGPGAGLRALGNALIAFGALLPGIGGSLAKAGLVEALYVGEFVGALFIWAGFAFALRAGRAAEPAPAAAPAP